MATSLEEPLLPRTRVFVNPLEDATPGCLRDVGIQALLMIAGIYFVTQGAVTIGAVCLLVYCVLYIRMQTQHGMAQHLFDPSNPFDTSGNRVKEAEEDQTTSEGPAANANTKSAV
ncbi:unnamed protein product [Amoebophrya sp. A120]|nr:unnamed protein product [Amoebophrya sp. A120]|eukprot:GSA120T00005563001.1